jgi:hypothetical protein
MKNILFFCMDSCRYDTFIAADAPNMKAVGEVEKAHSPACWTVPSVTSYLMNEGPIRGKRYRLFDGAPGLKWLPKWFQQQGYLTVFDTWNACVQTAPHIRDGFDLFCVDALGHSRDEYTAKMAKTLHEAKRVGKKIFAFILVMDTHIPYFWGTGGRGWENDPLQNRANQVKAIEWVDKQFPEFLRIMKPATVYITADHGDLHEPPYSHSPAWGIHFDEKLFEIPFIVSKGERT